MTDLFIKKGKCNDCKDYVSIDELVESKIDKNSFICINCKTRNENIKEPKERMINKVALWVSG